MITLEIAALIREAFGANSFFYETQTDDRVMERCNNYLQAQGNYELFPGAKLSDRTLENWLAAQVEVEEIRRERSNDFDPEPVQLIKDRIAALLARLAETQESNGF